ncbi:MAG: carbonic anhydrase family protein [Desulfobacterales bacterium]
MKTNTLDIDRRNFMKNTGGSLLAAGMGSSLALSALQAHAAQAAVTQNKETQDATTPQKALQMLKDGNARFVQGNMLQRNLMRQVKATGGGQFPFAAIVGCIDSRVPNELIFDQGIGDIFSARIAGNFVNDDILGSLEFACALSGAKLILVLGHTECGAVKGACDDVVLGNLTQTLANIKPAVAAVSGYGSDRSSKNDKFVQAVTDKNVVLTVERIRERSPILQGMVDEGQIGLAGAMYNVHSGKVTFM